MNILVLFGGQSTEHFVSNRSAYEIIRVLKRMGHKVAKMGITQKGEFLPVFQENEILLSKTWAEDALLSNAAFLKTKSVFYEKRSNTFPFSLKKWVLEILEPFEMKNIDLVFPIIHGNQGEDGVLQGFLEMLGLPYMGCRLGASYLGMDKVMAKRLWKEAGLPVVEWLTLEKENFFSWSAEEKTSFYKKVQERLGCRLFVKPLQGGSSVGANRAFTEKALEEALLACFEVYPVALIEPYLECRELEIGILGRYPSKEALRCSAVVEIKKQDDTFYDYEAKYGPESTAEVLFETDVSPEMEEKMQHYARKAFQVLGCTHLARVDFFLDKESGQLYLNEINTLPGFTQTSGYARAFEKKGVSYETLLEHFISFALKDA